MNLIDSIFLAILLVLAIRGAIKGFIKQFLALTSFAAGILCSIFFKDPTVEFIANYYPDVQSYSILITIGWFLVVYLLFRWVSSLFTSSLKAIGLSTINRILGALTGAALAILLVCGGLFLTIAVYELVNQPLPKEIQESHSFEFYLDIKRILPNLL